MLNGSIVSGKACHKVLHFTQASNSRLHKSHFSDNNVYDSAEIIIFDQK